MISKGPEGRTSLIKFEFWGSTRGQSKLFHSGPDKPDPAGPYMINFLILSLILILIQILRKQAQIVGRYNECYVQCRRLLNYSKTTSAPPSEASVNIYLTLWIVRANNKIVTLSNAKKNMWSMHMQSKSKYFLLTHYTQSIRNHTVSVPGPMVYAGKVKVMTSK